jgi:hypothetical protein
LPRRRGLLLQLLVDWLHRLDERFRGTPEFVRGLLSLAEATCTLGYSRDALHVAWYPPGVSIIEQGEPATSLYLILSGHADVVREAPDGTLHKVNEIGPGAFFGEEGIATQQPRNANIIARDSVSCMVLSPGEPTRYAGRGEYAQHCVPKDSDSPAPCAATTRIEVSAYVPQKMAAMASYRTQCPMPPDLLPQEMLREMFAHEYFVRVYPAFELETELYPSHLLRLHHGFKQHGASDVHQFDGQLSGA